MAKKVCLVTDQHISTNPRVWKEADALARAGYEVSIVTVFKSSIGRENDKAILRRVNSSIQYKPAYSTIPDELPFADKLFYKLRTAWAMLIKNAGIDSKYLLAKAPEKIVQQAISENADLYIAHVDCSLLIGRQLIEKGKRVAYDFEDWYAEDYINKYRPAALYKKLEQYAMRHGKYITCPSGAMAEALNKTHPCTQMPEVVYNTFPEETLNTYGQNNPMPVLVWFSQTVGGGRGLEELIESLHQLDIPVKLMLVGDCNDEYREHLEHIFPSGKGHVLELKPPVPHDELHALLAGCDVGLALEQSTPESRNKTITNKILQYLQAGLKVLATDTDGQKEVSSRFPDAIELVIAEDNDKWAERIKELLSKSMEPEDIIDTYNLYFPWSKQEEKILELVEKTINE